MKINVYKKRSSGLRIPNNWKILGYYLHGFIRNKIKIIKHMGAPVMKGETDKKKFLSVKVQLHKITKEYKAIFYALSGIKKIKSGNNTEINMK